MKDTSSHTAYGHPAAGENKKSMYRAMIGCRCPICTQGHMFKTRATNPARFNELRKNCEVCGFDFMPEPGFYQISLYFTYAINVGVFLIGWACTYLLFRDPPLWLYLVVVCVPAIVITPWNLRYSKVVMLYFFGNIGRYKEAFGHSE